MDVCQKLSFDNQGWRVVAGPVLTPVVKYWSLDGKVLAMDGKVLASGLVNSGLERLPEKSGTVWEKINQMAGCVDKTEACQKF